MNIIEREIAERKAVIASKEEKMAQLEALKQEELRLAEEIASINVEVLVAEVTELEDILHRLNPTEDVIPNDETSVVG